MQRDKSIFIVAPLEECASLYLDVLRLVFSQLVLIGHAASFFGVLPFILPPYFPWIQSIAVVGFFWLSGFLICHSVLLRKQGEEIYRFSDFFFSRFARIYSAYIPALFFVLLVDSVFIGLYPEKYGFYRSYSVEAAIKNIFMLQKFPVKPFSAPMFGSASTWWTLGIEWWLYMFFGWIFIMKRTQIRPVYFWSILFAVSIVPLHSAVKGMGVGVGLSLVWVMACGIAITKDIVCESMSRKVMLAASMLFATLAAVRYRISMDAYDLIAAMHLGGALLFSTCWMQGLAVKPSQMLKKIVHFVAGYSFTLFLTHYTILYFIKTAELLHGWPAFVVSFLLSNLIAALIAFWTEMRYRNFALFLKKYWKQLAMTNHKVS